MNLRSSLLGLLDKRSQGGMTLIELMIGLIIGLLITLMVSLIYSNAFQMFRTQSVVAKMQEGARSVVGTMSREIQMAGFLACGGVYGSANYSMTSSNRYPVIKAYIDVDGAKADQVFSDQYLPSGVTIPPKDTTGKAPPQPLLVVSHGSEETAALADHSPNGSLVLSSESAAFKWSSLPAANEGRTQRQFIIADCSQSQLFSANSVSDASITASDLTRTYDETARVMLAERSVFFLAMPDSKAKHPSLYQAFTSAGNTTYLRIADNVAGIAYGFGYGSSDGASTLGSYVQDPNEWKKWTESNWKRVKSVRVSVLIASQQRQIANSSGASNKYLFNGAQYDAPDGSSEIFREMEFTVAVRNNLAKLVSAK